MNMKKHFLNSFHLIGLVCSVLDHRLKQQQLVLTKWMGAVAGVTLSVTDAVFTAVFY